MVALHIHNIFLQYRQQMRKTNKLQVDQRDSYRQNHDTFSSLPRKTNYITKVASAGYKLIKSTSQGWLQLCSVSRGHSRIICLKKIIRWARTRPRKGAVFDWLLWPMRRALGCRNTVKYDRVSSNPSHFKSSIWKDTYDTLF